MDISFVIPCYCSEKNLETVINRIYDTMRVKPVKTFEIILVNDNSHDGTWNRIISLSNEHREIVGINLSNNFGQHNALMAGFKVSSGGLIMTSDDDGQTPVEMIWEFGKKIDEGFDVVCAKYVDRKRSGISRKLGTFMNEYMLEKLLGKPKNVSMAAFFMAKRFVINEVCKYENAFPYMAGLILRTTKNIGNVEMVQEERMSGSSGYSLRKLLKLWVNGFTTFSVKPLRFFVKVGFVVSIIGIAIGIWAIIKKFIYADAVVVGYTSLLSGMFILGGLNLMVMGIVGEYIGRIYMCTNSQPQFVIKNYAVEGEEKDEL